VIASVGPEAEFELTDGAAFYAREATVDLGLAFITEFERTLDRLCEYPELGPRWRGRARRMPLRRFPYSVIYEIRGEELRVLALAHQSRKSGYWRGGSDNRLRPDRRMPNFSLNADAIWRPLRGRAVAGQL